MRQKLLWLLALLGLVLFQNCSQTKPLQPASSHGTSVVDLTAKSENGNVFGNGTGIEGKITYRSHDIGRCGVDQSVVSEIVKDNSGHLMVTKENCRNIDPRPLEGKIVQSPPTPTLITVGNLNFEETNMQTFVKPGDFFIYAVCRSQAVVKGTVVGYADGVLRVIRDTSKVGYFVQGEFSLLMPKIFRSEMEKMTTQELRNVPKVSQYYKAPMIPILSPSDSPAIELMFRVPEAQDPYLDLQLAESRPFSVWFLKESYQYIQLGVQINGQLNVPRNHGTATFWAPAHCDRLVDFHFDKGL